MADNKDRHSRMATSSVNQPMKKGGGGTANWGNTTEAIYDPVGHQHQTVATGAVTYSVAPAQYVPYQPMSVNVGDAQHFPTLGGATQPMVQMAAPVTTWGPSTQVLQAAPMTSMPSMEGQVRQGVVFDAAHPRNAFAKKPHVTTGGYVEQGQPAAIDWSQAGTATVQQAMLHVAANPAVHGQTPGVSVYPSTPLNVLRAQPVYMQPQPTQVKQVYAKPVYQKVTQCRGS